ncbi:MAG: diguanylate cyclase [Planctomycetes bacterium]|nr:diguanylate cyclase [Planctomycetota bacterium]
MTAVQSERAQTGQKQLTVAQMLHVMRVEFHRARSQRYPLVCAMLSIDGLEGLSETCGFGTKQRLMRAAYDLLRATCREQACIGMALMAGERIMAVFPNLAPTRASDLGRVLCERARASELPTEGGIVTLALSIGMAHNLLAETNSSFEGIVQIAGRALSMARDGGGGKSFLWREAEAELEQLRDELAERKKSFEEQHAVLQEEVSEIGGLQKAEVLDRLQALFAGVARTDAIAELERQVLAVAAKELFEERQKAIQKTVDEHKRQIDQLERRIAKLTQILGVTEEELKRVMAMKAIDSGVASIFREVQGLTASEEQGETKKAMMSAIFEANLAFQKRAAPAGAA